MVLDSHRKLIEEYKRRVRKRFMLSAFLFGLLAFLVIFDIQVGSSNIELKELLKALAEGPNSDSSTAFIVWEIRLPMTFTCLFVGASLSLAGLLIQTITHNPLASPYTLGVTAGASFGAAIAITMGFAVLGQTWIGVSLSVLLIALLVSGFIFYLGSRKSLSATTLILVGVIMNFFFQALQQYLQYCASPEVAQIISGWTFGNLQRASWISSAVSFVTWLGALFIAFGLAWKLTALSDGTERAKGLGINTDRLRIFVFSISSVLVSSAVAFIGTVAFVGLISPHCARLILGDDQRFLILNASVIGSSLMLAASIISKLMSEGATLPVGIVTSVIGVPFLFFLLMRTQR